MSLCKNELLMYSFNDISYDMLCLTNTETYISVVLFQVSASGVMIRFLTSYG